MRENTHEQADTGPSFAGVDGCRAGWVVVLAHPLARDAQEHQVTICARFDDVLALLPTSAVSAVDIPIGLLTEQQPGGRDCDRCARRLLGRRASSVFTPTRPHLAPHYARVRGHSLSIQAFNILPKIREVDRVMTPALQQRVYEARRSWRNPTIISTGSQRLLLDVKKDYVC
jgi:predicted RNase H-like nuclease